MTKIKFLLLVFLFVVCIVLINFVFSKFFIIKKITCFENNQPCPSELTNQLNELKNKSLFFFDFEKYIFDKNFTVKLDSFKKELPDHLIFYFTLTQSDLYLQIEGTTYQIDQNSQIIPAEKKPDTTTTLISNQNQQILETQTIPASLQDILSAIITVVTTENYQNCTIEITDDQQITLFIDSYPPVIISHTDYRRELTKTVIILNNLETIEQNVKQIDVRFDHPVLDIE